MKKIRSYKVYQCTNSRSRGGDLIYIFMIASVTTKWYWGVQGAPSTGAPLDREAYDYWTADEFFFPVRWQNKAAFPHKPRGATLQKLPQSLGQLSHMPDSWPIDCCHFCGLVPYGPCVNATFLWPFLIKTHLLFLLEAFVTVGLEEVPVAPIKLLISSVFNSSLSFISKPEKSGQNLTHI